MLNWRLLSQPLNWVIIWVILFGGALVFHLIAEKTSPPTAA